MGSSFSHLSVKLVFPSLFSNQLRRFECLRFHLLFSTHFLEAEHLSADNHFVETVKRELYLAKGPIYQGVLEECLEYQLLGMMDI